MLIKLKSEYILKFNFLMAHLSRGDYLSIFMVPITGIFPLGQIYSLLGKTCTKKITSVKHEGSWSTHYAMEIMECGVL